MFPFFAARFFCRESNFPLAWGARILIPQFSCCRPAFKVTFCRPLGMFTRLVVFLFIMPCFCFMVFKIKLHFSLTGAAQLRRHCGFAVVACGSAFPIPVTASAAAVFCLWLASVLTRSSLVAGSGGGRFFRPSRRAPTFLMPIVIHLLAMWLSRPSWWLQMVIIGVAAFFVLTLWPRLR